MNEQKIVAFKERKISGKTSQKPKKKPKNFFFSCFIGLFIGTVLYLALPISRLSVIMFEGTQILSRAALVELSGLRENALIPTLRLNEIEARLQEHPLVERAQVSLTGFNRLLVSIQEKEVVVCADIDGALHYILENGQLLVQERDMLPLCRGLVVYGLTDEALRENVLELFVAGLAELDPLFVSLINHIDYEPRWGNSHRFSLSMRDGNTVKISSHTMVENLSRYQTWVSALEEGVTGIFNFDVGNVFQPFSTTE